MCIVRLAHRVPRAEGEERCCVEGQVHLCVGTHVSRMKSTGAACALQLQALMWVHAPQIITVCYTRSLAVTLFN